MCLYCSSRYRHLTRDFHIALERSILKADKLDVSLPDNLIYIFIAQTFVYASILSSMLNLHGIVSEKSGLQYELSCLQVETLIQNHSEQ